MCFDRLFAFGSLLLAACRESRKLEVGSLKLEAGPYLIQSKYKVCCNRLMASSCWLLAAVGA